jgi:hypothetical protein
MVLRDIAHDDIRIEADHHRLRIPARIAMPAAMASFISST